MPADLEAHWVTEPADLEAACVTEPADLEAAWVAHASRATIKRMRDEARALGRYRIRAFGNGMAAAAADRARFSGEPEGIRPLSDERWSASLRREAGTALRRVREFGLRAAGIIPPGQDCEPIGPTAEPDVFHEAAPDVFHGLLHESDTFLRLRLPADLATDFLAAIEAARAWTEETAAAVPWDVPWPPGPCDASWATVPSASACAARIAFVRARRVPMWVGLLALLEGFVDTWDTDAAGPERRDDAIYIRDGWRCAAPGCSSRRNLQDHHVVYRSHLGSDDHSNRVTLCSFHHLRGEHGGLMSVRGQAPLALTWRLGRADVAVEYRAEVAVRDRPDSSKGPTCLAINLNPPPPTNLSID